MACHVWHTLVDNGVCGPRGALTFNPDTFDELTLFLSHTTLEKGSQTPGPGPLTVHKPTTSEWTLILI